MSKTSGFRGKAGDCKVYENKSMILPLVGGVQAEASGACNIYKSGFQTMRLYY
jgi:hypothetical protein